MKKSKIISIMILYANTLYAQNEAMNWYFGFNAGISFSTNPPTALSGGQIHTHEGCSTISDSLGNLLFYSDGKTVWDNTHSIMQNGTGLWGNASSTQSALIVPVPGSSVLYNLFTAPAWSSNHPLAYSKINITLNNGLGKVVNKNIALLDTSTEKVTAVRHQNGTDIWIIGHSWPNNSFYVFLSTSSGVSSTPVISSVGSWFNYPIGKLGYLKASACGNQIAMVQVGPHGKIEVFDFDNSTGIISNPLQLLHDTINYNYFYGVEFSPDNSKLYSSDAASGEIVQYNLAAGSPTALYWSRTLIGTSGTCSGSLQIGLDGKIYVTNCYDSTLACITNPNQLGLSCGYVNDYISLGTSDGVFGLPGFLTSDFCNLQTGLNSNSYSQSISIYPNPFTDVLNISTSKSSEIILYDITSRKIFHQAFSNSTSIITEQLAKGIYLYEVRNKNGVIKKGKVVKK